MRIVQCFTIFSSDFAVPDFGPLSVPLLGLLLLPLSVRRICLLLWLCRILGEMSFRRQWPRDFLLLCSSSSECQRNDQVTSANFVAEAGQVKSVGNVLPARFILRVASFLISSS